MNVLFHSNNLKRDSPHYHYSFNYPPVGINYISADKSSDVEINMKNIPFAKTIIQFIRSILINNEMAIPNVSTVSTANNFDLVHSFNTIPITDKPFIVEMESFHSLFIGNYRDKRARNAIRTRLKSNNCKKILFWTKNAHYNFINAMNDAEIESKSEVLYPAVPLQKQIPFRKKPTLGFIGRNYKNKGGQEALRTMFTLAKSKKAKGLFITNELIKNEYPKDITIRDLMPRKELNEKIFPSIDILIYPGYSDSFGYIFPEAASFGIPILTSDGCARQELVDKKFIVPRKLSEYGYPYEFPSETEAKYIENELTNKTIQLISNKKLRMASSNYNYNLVKNGIFSIKKRNTALQKIYKEALKD